MKHLHIFYKSIFALLGLIFLFNACKEDKLELYGDNDNVYFDYWTSDKVLDSMNFSFAIYNPNTTAVRWGVPVQVMGRVVDFDRPIAYKVSPTSTAVEGVDFEIQEALVPAGRNQGSIFVNVNRAGFGGGVEKTIDLILEPNEYFQTNYPFLKRVEGGKTIIVNRLGFRIRASDNYTVPPLWNSRYVNYLGTFSRKKLFLLIEVAGATMQQIYANTGEAGLPGIADIVLWGSILKRYLQNMTLAGTPVMEDDGSPMTSGVYA